MNTVLSNKSLRILVLITITFFSMFLSSPTFADQLKIPFREYSINNIYFVKECEKGNARRTINSTAQASGSSADEKIWSALKSLGLSDEITAGILGNIHNEGGASPARHEGCFGSCSKDGYDWENDASKAKGLGLIQWSFGRRVNLIKHLRSKGAGNLVDKYLLNNPEKYGGLSGDQFIQAVDNPADADQLYALEIDFLIDEIKNNSSYSPVLNQTTVADAAEEFSIRVEGCNECTVRGGAENKERIAAAEQIYTTFTGKVSFSNPARKSSNLTPCDCDDGGNLIGGGLYAGAKYNITDEDTLKRLWWAARAEQGTENAKTELTFFVNRFEKMGGTPGDVSGLISSIHNSGPGGREYASTTPEAYDTGVVHWPGGEVETFSAPTAEEIAAVKDIIVNGHRTMPPQVVEHDSIDDITRLGGVSNNGSSFSPGDKSQYKVGVTKIVAYGTPYIFFQWANGETVCSDNCGDPFGYFEDDPPSASSSTTTETGSTTWDDDGWITGGLDGHTKEDGSKIRKLSKNANQDFTTDMPNTKGKGPTKVNITATEGPNGAGDSGLELFKSRTESKPPHFTVDLQNRKIYQHFPIYKTSGANVSTDDGIQIAVIGYTDEEKAKKDKNENLVLSSLNASDYTILSDLMQAINNATGIESTNITAPGSILTNLQSSISSQTITSDCAGNGSGIGLISGHCFDISEGDGGCTEDGFTWFAQGGDSWGDDPYGYHGTIRSAGCGPSALAMIVTALTGQLHTPKEVAPQAAAHGARADNGSYGDKLAETAQAEYNLQYQHVDDSQVTEDNVNNWLSEGKMMLFSVGPYNTEFGPLTGGGHFIAIRGKTSDGKWLTFDSARRDQDRNNRHYTPNDILQAYLTHGKGNFYLIYR